MPEDQNPSSPRTCRQCGALVPENTIECPRCGKKWYLDRVEEQGVNLWQKIIEKRAAAGMGDAAPREEQRRQYRCPNCMAVLKTPAAVCPICGKSTAKAKIVPAEDEEVPVGLVKGQFNDLPDAARGLAAIKGAGKRARKIKGRKRFRMLDIIIVIAIVAIMAVILFLTAQQYGLIPAELTFFKPQGKVQTAVTTTVISGISAQPDGTGKVTISWNTDIASDGKVIYGKTGSYGMTADTSSKATIQNVSLSNLEPATTYHYAVIVIGDNGTETARSQDSIFTTIADGDKDSPVISQDRATAIDIGAVIQWVTDEPSTSQVLFGTSPACDRSTDINSQPSTSHSVKITGLEPNVTYYYRIKSVDPAGNEALTAPSNAFVTLISVPMGSRIGDRAPDFTLPVFKTQETISLKNFKGKNVLVTFWAVHCPECDRELSLLQTLRNKNLADVVVLAVFLESKPDDIEKLVARIKSERGDLTVPVLVDTYKTTSHLYNVDKLPTTFFIDGDRIVREIEYGSFNLDQIEQVLKNL